MVAHDGGPGYSSLASLLGSDEPNWRVSVDCLRLSQLRPDFPSGEPAMMVTPLEEESVSLHPWWPAHMVRPGRVWTQ